MTKKMRDLLTLIEQHNQKAQEYMNSEAPDIEKATAELDVADKLQQQYDLFERLEKAEKTRVPIATEEIVNGFGIMTKLMRGKTLTEQELRAITLDEKSAQQLVTGDNALNGENYLCPEEVDTAIREMRKTYVQARDFITVEPTIRLTGRCVFDKATTPGLIKFDDGDELNDENAPNFSNKTWNIGWYGAFIPVSQILEDAERASLESYLNRWFVRRAVVSENQAIFETLRNGYNDGELEMISGCEGLRESINLKLTSASRKDGVIITNQTGFNILDRETDGEGRHYLQPDMTQPGVYRFRGMRVIEFDDGELENVSSGSPIFFGNLKAAAIMKLYKNLLFASSAHANFTKAQTLFRVIEGFDVFSADTSAYVAGVLAASD